MIRLIFLLCPAYLVVAGFFHNVRNHHAMLDPIPSSESVYKVKKTNSPVSIDGKWDKPAWAGAEALSINRSMGTVPPFVPVVEAKLMYDASNIYVIFRVQDRFVRSTVTNINGPVSENSCVEFFFSPDSLKPLQYFNLEVNAGGTPLIFYVTEPWKSYTKLEDNDIMQIEIAHSMPKIVEPETKDPVTWTIEYRIPISVLSKYAHVDRPEPGVRWKANLYKTGSKTSNPNYMTWAFVDNPVPNFHLPKYFGTIEFGD